MPDTDKTSPSSTLKTDPPKVTPDPSKLDAGKTVRPGTAPTDPKANPDAGGGPEEKPGHD